MSDRRRGARMHRHRDLFAGEVPTWWSGAACRGQTSRFFADDRIGQADAVVICERCPVLEACRSWALGSPDPVPGGVAGGLTHAERKAHRRAVPAGTSAA